MRRKTLGIFMKNSCRRKLWFTEVDKGLLVGEKTTPIVDVCLYVPRGKGSFPSVLLMLGIPAVVAKVPQIVVVTPPNEKGEVDDAILAAAKIIGIENIYKVGGIQAVAAAAFGTQTIPKCHKIISDRGIPMPQRQSVCWPAILMQGFQPGQVKLLF